MTADNDIDYDRGLLGVEHTTGPFHVTREMIEKFARSTGETGTAFADDNAVTTSRDGGPVAPPTFCNVFVSRITRPDIKLEFGDVGFFAGQAIECLAPVRPGDTLEAKTKLQDVYAKTGRSGKMVFAVWETRFKNQRGELVAVLAESFVRRKLRG